MLDATLSSITPFWPLFSPTAGQLSLALSLLYTVVRIVIWRTSFAHFALVLSFRAFYRRRVQFNQFLSSNTALTASRYFRLMALSMTELCCTLPLASFMIWVNSAAAPVAPWVSWENTHFNFSRVGQYPSVIWTQDYLFMVAVQLTRWSVVACAFIFFAFFGFAAEARKNYSTAFGKAAKLFKFRQATSPLSVRYANWH